MELTEAHSFGAFGNQGDTRKVSVSSVLIEKSKRGVSVECGSRSTSLRDEDGNAVIYV